MGSTHATSGNKVLRFNPSLLSTTLDTNPSFVDFQINLNTIEVKEEVFGKRLFWRFLTYADYVNNVDMYNFLQGGFLSKVIIIYIGRCIFTPDFI